MKLGDRVLFASVPLLLIGGAVALAAMRRDEQRRVDEYNARMGGVQWDGGARWLQPRPGVRRRIV
jgi:hypothetical protein